MNDTSAVLRSAVAHRLLNGPLVRAPSEPAPVVDGDGELAWPTQTGAATVIAEVDGGMVPLVEVDPDSFKPLDSKLPFDPGTVPAFVLVEDGREVARLNGYSGDELFWMSMQRMLDQLPQ